MQSSENIVLYVIGKYGRPISVQALHRGIRNKIISTKQTDFDWLEVVEKLKSRGYIETKDSFSILSNTGLELYNEQLKKWEEGKF